MSEICPKWDKCQNFKCHDEQICLNGDFWSKYWGSKARATIMANAATKPQNESNKGKRYKQNWKGICHYCERKLVGKLFSTRDHLIPIAQGGSNDIRNSVEACQRCNSLKGNRTPDQFANELGYWISGGKRGISKDTLILVLYNTRKLIIEIAPYRHELIRVPVVENGSCLPPIPVLKPPKLPIEELEIFLKKERTLKDWLEEVYYPMCHPNPEIFHEKS